MRTQSPMMARCMTSEKYGRPVFYGAMITEGIVALIWAAAATYFFHTDEGTALFAASSGNDNAAIIVNSITRDWLGTLGGLLAVLGVIAAPITSGDTAFRSARLIVADFMRLDQRPILKRLAISVPLFVAGFVILQIDFAVLWRYFAWCNQTLAVFTLWALTVYLVRERKLYAITLIPALFTDGRLLDLYLYRRRGTGSAPESLLRIGRSGEHSAVLGLSPRDGKDGTSDETPFRTGNPRIAGEVPGKRLTEPERTPRLGIAARKKPLQMPDEGGMEYKVDMATGMKHVSFRPYGEALSKPIGRIGLPSMLACRPAWTGCRRPDRPSSVSERLQERKWIGQFPGPKDYSCEMRFTATERIVTLVYMGRHESRSDYRLFDEPACRFDPAETAGNEKNGRYIVTRTLVRGRKRTNRIAKNSELSPSRNCPIPC